MSILLLTPEKGIIMPKRAGITVFYPEDKYPCWDGSLGFYSFYDMDYFLYFFFKFSGPPLPGIIKSDSDRVGNAL